MASYDQLDYAALFRSVNRDKPAEDPAKARGFMRGGADLGLEVASGVTRGVGMLANVFGANNPVSQGARSADEFIREYLSAQSKEDSARAAAILAEAEDAGIGTQVMAGLRAFAQNPASTVANTLGMAVPTIAGGMAAMGGRAAAGGARALGTMAGIGGASGVGEAKGGIFEAVKSEQMKQPGMTEAEATAAAEAAQSYGGPNTGNLALAGGIGALSGATGFQPAAARVLGAKGMLSAATEQIEQGLVRRMSKGALVEGGTEFLQEGQQAYAQNIALQNEGFDVPAMRGVVAQGTMGAVAGGMLGGGFGALDRKRGEKPSEPSIKDIADAPTVDDAIKAFTDVLALEPEKAAKPAGSVDFEADPRFANAPVFANGRAPQVPVFASKQAADIYIGEQALLGNYEAQQEADGTWAVKPTAQAAAMLQRNTAPTAGDATEFEAIPTGEATPLEAIPSGEATEFEQVPTGDAAELDVETIQADDFLTGDGQPYGTKSGANMRARKEGLGPADVVQVAGGWVVRPQPTALSRAGQEVQPNNTRGTSAGDVLKAPDVNQPDLQGTAGLAAGAADGPGADAGGSGRVVRPDAVADGGMAGPAETPAPGSGTAVPVGSGARPDDPLIPAAGQQFTMDDKPYTVVSGGPGYVAIRGPEGSSQVILKSNKAWPKVQAALKGEPVQQTPVSSTDAPAPVQKAAESAQAAPADQERKNELRAVYEDATTRMRAARKTRDNTALPNDVRAAASVEHDAMLERLESAFGVKSAPAQKAVEPVQGAPADATIPTQRPGVGSDAAQPGGASAPENPPAAATKQPAQAQPGGTPSEGAATTQPTPGLEAPAAVTGKSSSEKPPATLKDRLAAASKAKKASTVYKTRRAAEEARTGNTQRLRKTKDGYILRDATDKELAAAEKAGRRLVRASVDVEKDSLLVAIAKLGGLNITERSDTIGEGNRNIGGKMLFTRTGQALDTLAAGALFEYGYVTQRDLDYDGGVRWLRDAIKDEFNLGEKSYSFYGLDAIEERERAAQEAEYMASKESEDIFSDLDADEIQAIGYTSASPEVQAATEQAVAEAMAQGVDVESVRERVSMQSEGLTQDEYETAVQQALAEAIAKSRSDDGRPDASPAPGSVEDRGPGADRQGQEEGLTLQAQDAESLRAKAEREQAARDADAAEQRRLAARDAAETRRKNKAEEDARAERVRKERADAAVDDFQLGQEPPSAVVSTDEAAGQGSVFDAPEPPPSAPTRNEPLIALRKRVAILKALKECLA